MLRSIFVLSILIPGLLLAFTSRFRALLLYMWFAFFRPQEWLWANIRDYRFSLVIGLVLIVPAVFTGVFPNVTHPISIGFVLFMISGLLGQANAIDPATGWQWIDIQATLTVVCLLAITIIRTSRQLMLTLAVAIGSLVFFSSKAGLLSILAGGKQYGEGLAGSFPDNNAWAVAIVMSIPFQVALAQNAGLTFDRLVPDPLIRWIKMAWYISIPLSAYTIVSTFSRGGFLALLATLFTYMLFHRRRVRFMIVLGLLGSLLFFVPLPQGYVDRLATIQQLQEDVEHPRDDVTEGRFYFWGVAWNMVQDYPLGVGMRNFGALYATYDTLGGVFGKRRDVHSSHFQVLVEQGYLGAAVWIWMFGYSLALSLRIRKRARTPGLPKAEATLIETLPLAMIVSMAGFVVGGGTVSMALNDLTWLTFALLASLDRVSAARCAEALGNGRALPAERRFQPQLAGSAPSKGLIPGV